MLVNAVQPGATWCKIVKDSARWCRMVQGKVVHDGESQCNAMQHHTIPSDTTQYHANYAIPCTSGIVLQDYAIPRHTMQCSAIQCNALLYHTIPISSTTADGDDLMEIKADNVCLVW